MIKIKKTMKAHLLLGVATLLLGGCEFIEQIEASSGPKKCVGGGIKKAEVQELLTNNAKQYENRIKHLENIIESMGVNVDEMMMAPQPAELQTQVELPPMYGAMPQAPVQMQTLPQANGQPMNMQQNMFARSMAQPVQQAQSWQNPNIQPTMPKIHPMAGPQKQVQYPQQQAMQQPLYPQQQQAMLPQQYPQQPYYQAPQQQPIQPTYNQQPQPTAPTSGTVLNFRTGVQKGGNVRLVFDTTGFTNVRKQVNGNVMTIDLPNLSWNGAPSGYLGKNPLVASYNTQPLQGEAGTRLTLNLKKSAFPGQEGRIKPNKDSNNHRMFMDIIGQ